VSKVKNKYDFTSARILVTRTDRLGDVLLATPVLSRIVEFYPQAQVSFLVQKPWLSILPSELTGQAVELIEYDPKSPGNELTALLKSKNFDVAIVLRDEKKITKAVRRAKIPVRVGPYSSLRSFFAFNAGILQKRSQCKMHEAEYNLELLTKIGINRGLPARTASELPRSWIHLQENARQSVNNFLRAQDLTEKKYLCFHPGSSGSARYLSTAQMIEFTRVLLARGHAVVLTGSEAEAPLLEEIQAAASGARIFGGREPKPLSELAALYENAQGLIAHGTGPLHVAAATSTAVLAIFSPIFVLSEKRWGPLTPRRMTWLPPAVNCPAKFKCHGPKCRYYDCMSRFVAIDVAEKFEKIL
jgi:heptosyltransferase-3